MSAGRMRTSATGSQGGLTADALRVQLQQQLLASGAVQSLHVHLRHALLHPLVPIPATPATATADAQSQTEEEAVAARLAAVEREFEAQRAALQQQSAQAAQHRVIMSEQEHRRHMQHEIEEEKNRFRRLEEARIRLEVETKLRQELEVERQRLQESYQLRQQHLETKERAMRESFASKERHLEASTHAERQKLLLMMEKLEAKESQLQHEATSHSRTFQQRSDATQHAWASLELKEAALRGLQDDYERRLAAATQEFKLKWEEEQSQRRLALDNRERDLGRQIELVEAQKAAQQAAQAEAARLSEDVRRLHTELGRVTGQLAAAEARLERTQDFEHVMAGHSHLEQENQRLLQTIALLEERQRLLMDQMATLRSEHEAEHLHTTHTAQLERDRAQQEIESLQRSLAAEKAIAEAEHNAAMEARNECARLRQMVLDLHSAAGSLANLDLPPSAMDYKRPDGDAHDALLHVFSSGSTTGWHLRQETPPAPSTKMASLSSPENSSSPAPQSSARRRLLDEARDRLARLDNEDKEIESQLALLKVGVPLTDVSNTRGSPTAFRRPLIKSTVAAKPQVAFAGEREPATVGKRLDLRSRQQVLDAIAAGTSLPSGSPAVEDEKKTELGQANNSAASLVNHDSLAQPAAARPSSALLPTSSNHPLPVLESRKQQQQQQQQQQQPSASTVTEAEKRQQTAGDDDSRRRRDIIMAETQRREDDERLRREAQDRREQQEREAAQRQRQADDELRLRREREAREKAHKQQEEEDERSRRDAEERRRRLEEEERARHDAEERKRRLEEEERKRRLEEEERKRRLEEEEHQRQQEQEQYRRRLEEEERAKREAEERRRRIEEEEERRQQLEKEHRAKREAEERRQQLEKEQRAKREAKEETQAKERQPRDFSPEEDVEEEDIEEELEAGSDQFAGFAGDSSAESSVVESSTKPTATAATGLGSLSADRLDSLVDDQLAKYMALVQKSPEKAAATDAREGDEEYSASFEASPAPSSKADSFAAGAGLRGVEGGRSKSATPSRTPSLITSPPVVEEEVEIDESIRSGSSQGTW